MSIHFQQTDLHSWDIHAHPPIGSKTAPIIGTITEKPSGDCQIAIDGMDPFISPSVSHAQQRVLTLGLERSQA